MDRRDFIKKATMAAVGAMVLIMTSLTASAQTFQITSDGYFNAGGTDVMAFSDFYPEGHQGGVCVIMNGHRIAVIANVQITNMIANDNLFIISDFDSYCFFLLAKIHIIINNAIIFMSFLSLHTIISKYRCLFCNNSQNICNFAKIICENRMINLIRL